MIAKFLVPSNLRLKVESIYSEKGVLNIQVSACQKYSICPICGKKSKRIHSWYCRILEDLPASGHLVRIKFKARRYFCKNEMCARKIFTERFDYEIRPYYRRMLRSNELLKRMVLELGGNTGASISRYVGLPVSPSTMLRVIKRIEIETRALTSGVLGVDDWAFKKGKTYGTVIVDLARKEVIELLPDRESTTLAEWLRKHPEVKTVSRDRYGPYALGAKIGAPQANQVADRFHLMMNLGEATKRIFQSKGKELREIFTLFNDPKREKCISPDIDQTLEPMLETDKSNISANIGVHRQYKFNKVKELHRNGITLRKIARITGLARGTVRKYVAMEQLEKRQFRSSTNLEVFINFLLREDNRGKTYRELHKTIVLMGFNGKYTQFCYKLNKMYNISPATTARQETPKTIKTWSPKKLSLMLYMEPEQLQESEDKDFLRLLFEKLPEIKQVELQVKSFKHLFVTKKDGMLKKWIEQTLKSECGLKNFARNLLNDYQAINNAVLTTISNGQVEGQVNRIKNIKRKMYGRAGFQLLRKMVLAKLE